MINLLEITQLSLLLLTAFCGAVSSIVGLVLLARQLQMHLMMNSRLDQLILETNAAARSAGEAAGRAAEQLRAAEELRHMMDAKAAVAKQRDVPP